MNLPAVGHITGMYRNKRSVNAGACAAVRFIELGIHMRFACGHLFAYAAISNNAQHKASGPYFKSSAQVPQPGALICLAHLLRQAVEGGLSA
jgi:hypothetical protein